MNIYEFAMDMELDGKKYYEGLMNNATNEGIKNIFKMLAEDEQKHYDIIKEMKNKGDLNVSSETLRNANNIFSNMLKSKEKFNGDDSTIKAYKHARELEEKSIKMYEDYYGKANEESEKILFKRLAEEEKKHRLILDNIIEFVNEPNKNLGVKTKESDPEFARWDKTDIR